MTITPEMLKLCAETVGYDTSIFDDLVLILNSDEHRSFDPRIHAEQDRQLLYWLHNEGWAVIYERAGDGRHLIYKKGGEHHSFDCPPNELCVLAVCAVRGMK